MAAMEWWKTAVIYQIYPRSFQDSNDDGIGDLPGILARLPHLAEMGVDAMWLSPVFPSPMADFGYDICDYTGIDPLFGRLGDFDLLVHEAHRQGIRIILDLVPNHSSDQHPWFLESRRSRDNPKRDWYLWRDPGRDGGPPNNWMSEFGGSAWEWDAATGQYYYHAFLPAQPDLNWRNPQVRAAIYDAMRFWFRRGVDGFRIDVLWHLAKDEFFRDNPPNPNFRAGSPPHHAVVPLYTTDRPEVHQIIEELRDVADEFPQRLLIGEIYLPLEKLMAYYGRDLKGVHLPFNFTLLGAAWKASNIARLITDYEKALPAGGWPNWVLGNHDQPRIASRIGPAPARAAALLLLTLRGTPTIYYGEEIGMEQAILTPDQIRDPFERRVPGLGLGRDGCRTPMQWNGEIFAGFSNAAPWLPLSPDHADRNVACQKEETDSVYNLYRALLALRRSRPALSRGSFDLLEAGENVLTYMRTDGAEKLLVAINFSDQPADYALSSDMAEARLLLSSLLDGSGRPVKDTLRLRPHEGVIVEHL
jgi:alpha-glucosidase